MCHRWTVYVTLKSPKGWHKTQFCCFCQSTAKFLCVKTSRGKVVATSFLYLTIHRRVAGHDPIYLKFALKVTHPLVNADFDRFRLIVPQLWELAKNVQLSVVWSWQCAHWAIDEPCVLPLSPQKGGAKREFYIIVLPFIFLLKDIRRHFKFDVQIDHCKSQPMDDKLSRKGHSHVTWSTLNFRASNIPNE